MSDIGLRIKEGRERFGYSQEAFGLLGGVKKTGQLNYGKDKRSPSGDHFERLRKYPEVDVNYIVTGMRTGPSWDEALADQADKKMNLVYKQCFQSLMCRHIVNFGL